MATTRSTWLACAGSWVTVTMVRLYSRSGAGCRGCLRWWCSLLVASAREHHGLLAKTAMAVCCCSPRAGQVMKEAAPRADGVSSSRPRFALRRRACQPRSWAADVLLHREVGDEREGCCRQSHLLSAIARRARRRATGLACRRRFCRGVVHLPRMSSGSTCRCPLPDDGHNSLGRPSGLGAWATTQVLHL